MQLSEQVQAVLLLTTWLGKQDQSGTAPLTPTEWGRFAKFLRDTDKQPADLLDMPDTSSALTGFNDKKITHERISKLLERSAALGIALEKWQRAGLWVLIRSDEDYPKQWKHWLKYDAPPILFGAGNRALLNQGGIAVVGSRDLNDEQIDFTAKLGHMIAHQGQSVISGGARGADQAAMLGALEADGTAIGVLADSLLRACTSAKYRQALMRNDLALVSPFNPEAGFNAGNAMARNKYIYCLSNAAIVIAATENKGGTWAGAIEDLKRQWVPLWVREDSASGNKALVHKGANWLPENFTVEQLIDLKNPITPPTAHMDEDLAASTLQPTPDHPSPEKFLGEPTCTHTNSEEETQPEKSNYQEYVAIIEPQSPIPLTIVSEEDNNTLKDKIIKKDNKLNNPSQNTHQLSFKFLGN